MKRVYFFLAALLLLVPCASFAAAFDPTQGYLSADKTSLVADGSDTAEITVVVRDNDLQPMPGMTVTLLSSRGLGDDIRVLNAVTDNQGKAYFLVDSLDKGSVTFSAQVGGQTIEPTITLNYTGGLTIPLSRGALIKIPDDGDPSTQFDTAVYYYAINGRRYVFTNEKSYFTWFPNFSKVVTVPADQMALIPIAGNVTYKPGQRLIKFPTDPKVYLVMKGGLLRWVQSEEVARTWYGADWHTHVDDVSDAFYTDYHFGAPISNAYSVGLDVIKTYVPTIDFDKGLIATF